MNDNNIHSYKTNIQIYMFWERLKTDSDLIQALNLNYQDKIFHSGSSAILFR